MNLRDALIQQGPSLALQRAAADEIARLDAELEQLKAERPQVLCADCAKMRWPVCVVCCEPRE